jgi:hypothetical protein
MDIESEKAVEVSYPQGQELVGAQWLTPLKGNHQEVYYSYNIMFRPGFVWMEGGKLPGPAGSGTDGSQPPTGGAAVGEMNGWSSRCMWRSSGRLAMYIYHQDMEDKYGDYYFLMNDDGTYFQFDAEQPRWYNITIRLVMNTVDQEGSGNFDGIVEGFIDGELKLTRDNMRFRNYSNMGIDWSLFCTFFGGTGDIWKPQRDEWVLFDDFIVYTYDSSVDVPRRNTPSPTGRTIDIPVKKPIITDPVPY